MSSFKQFIEDFQAINDLASGNDTPYDALKDIAAAFVERDYDKLTSRVDLTSFINIGYDDAIDQLAANCDEFHQKYPDDLLFQFGAQAIRDYNARYRLIHVGFIFSVINTYFNNATIEQPARFEDNPITFAAAHFDKLIQSLKARILYLEMMEDVTAATVDVTANAAPFDELIGTLHFRLEMKKIDDRWRLFKILNAAELVRPIVDIAEKIWPHSWDRGMQI